MQLRLSFVLLLKSHEEVVFFLSQAVKQHVFQNQASFQKFSRMIM